MSDTKRREAFAKWAMLQFCDCVEWDAQGRPYMAEDLRRGRPRQSLETEYSAWEAAVQRGAEAARAAIERHLHRCAKEVRPTPGLDDFCIPSFRQGIEMAALEVALPSPIQLLGGDE